MRADPITWSPSDFADLEQPIIRYYALPNGVKVSAQSIESVREQIDGVLDLPPNPTSPPDAP